ncbi:MAG: FecR family protein [Balneolaceae bacterium]|nr:FecR family protein [Balneolaceae bacterium]
MMNLKKLQKTLVLALAGVLSLGWVSAEVYNYLNPDRPLAYVRRFRPDVRLLPKNIMADRGEPLFNGDTLRTDNRGYAAVQFMDKSYAKVKPKSELIVRGDVKNTNSITTNIVLKGGEILLEITERRAGNEFEVTTSTAVASVKGTKFGVQENSSYFWVEEGLVDLQSRATGNTVQLAAMMFGQINADNTITTGEITREQLLQLNEDYESLNKSVTDPKIIKFRFRDKDGEWREIELKYYEN